MVWSFFEGEDDASVLRSEGEEENGVVSLCKKIPFHMCF